MKYQFMPMFWGDLCANTLHLSYGEFGAYMLLIAHAWEHGAMIACDEAQRIARVPNCHWAKVRKRLEPLFELTTMEGPPRYFHRRVHSELTKAGEISNKRKDAAMQMHSKSTSKSKANGHANDPHLHLQLPIEMLSCVREASDSTQKTTPAEPKPVAEKKPELYRKPTDEEASDYRSPPPRKSDNVLEPIPERPPFKRP